MTNQLFRDYLDGRIPVRRRIRPGFYFLPVGSFDPAAPTMADLAKGINLSQVVTIGLPPQAGLTTTAREADYEPMNRAIAGATESLQEMAAATRMTAEEIMNLLAKAGSAPDKQWAPAYTKPPPKPWAGNIATQKRRRKL